MPKKRIMVVDDEESFLKIVKLNLEATGNYEVVVLSHAKDIIEDVHRYRPDVILLDLLMPSVGGIEVCEKLNNDAVGKKTPIIIVSGLDKNQDKLKAYKLGIVDYLTKPIDAKTMIESIEKASRAFP